MQKLQLKLKNTPRNAFQVSCSVNSDLNKEEILSDQSIVLDCNNPEENLPRHREDRKLSCKVYVISKKENPLMPTNPCKAKHLLKQGKAVVRKRFPFTIQLTTDLQIERTQEVVLGIDTGYKNVGISCITEKEELFSANVKLRTDISKLLLEKKMYRRNRRSKLWYRKPRWKNRGILEGWLAPSVQHRLDSHLRIVEKIQSILPISKIIVEVANFDIQKIENPNIEGIDYQQGNLYGYENIKSYLVARENGKCQLCGKESTKGNSFRVHHCKQKNEVGSNRTKNLALLHKKCHTELHKKGLKLPAPKSYKAETFMSIIRWKIVEKLKEICETEVTFGYITKIERNKLGLQKDHYIDAFVIARGNDQKRIQAIQINQKRRNNRQLQNNPKPYKKGKVKIRESRYKIQSKDLIWIGKKIYVSGGCQNLGKYVCYFEDKKHKTIRIDLVKKYYNQGGFYETEYIQTPA